MTKLRRFIHIVFEKYGVLKMFSSAILGLLFFWLFDKTGNEIFKVISWIPGFYFAVLALILFTYAAFINPIKAWKKKRNKE